ncbi:NAD(P)H-hydrate dehydratase [Halorussus amylolyticus]|uniref:NAD(P)H-hydrate dehydratase n=1 Tax=Halorussus amylolyticus TaxID=1126242 RepID=UPI00104AB55F|nr:NAD(P)H-hydrate dehydratase [Halorussus amylolyticus]
MISSERMAQVDENAAALGVPRKQLMESSGNAVAREVRATAKRDSPDADRDSPTDDRHARVAVVAGRGNNGGDGLVAARFLAEHDVSVRLLGRAETISTDIARQNWDALKQADFDCEEVTDSKSLDLPDADVFVDAMLGTGVTGALREPEATAAEQMNDADGTVIAVDVPSGIDADTGDAAGPVVEADRVVTFHDEKPGLGALDTDVTVADIGIPAAAERYVGPGDMRPVRRGPPAADADPRVFVIGGGPYTGAPALAAQAALRVGANLSFVAAPETVAGEIQGYAEDLIVQPYDGNRLTPEEVPDLVDTAERYDDVVVLGPGLGNADETLDAAAQFLESFSGKAVVDADALPAVPEVETDATLVCTPNRKELAKMGGPEIERADALADSADEIEAFAADLGHVVVAKAKDDVVSDGEETRISRVGTPGMAVGGTGDTLAGGLAGLLGGHDPFESACMAAYANGRAGELLADRHGGLLASDLLDVLPRAVWGASDGGATDE